MEMQFMHDNFPDTAEMILRFKTHRDPLVRKTVISMIPALAAYDTQTFTEHFLHKGMAHLLQQLEKPTATERSLGAILLRSDSVICAYPVPFSLYCHWPHSNGCGERHEAVP